MLRVVCCFGIWRSLVVVCCLLLGVCCSMQCIAGSRLLLIDTCTFFVVFGLVVAVVVCYVLFVVCGVFFLFCCLLVVGVCFCCRYSCVVLCCVLIC